MHSRSEFWLIQYQTLQIEPFVHVWYWRGTA